LGPARPVLVGELAGSPLRLVTPPSRGGECL